MNPIPFMPDMTSSVRRVRVAFNAPPKKIMGLEKEFKKLIINLIKLKYITLFLKFNRKDCLVARKTNVSLNQKSSNTRGIAISRV